MIVIILSMRFVYALHTYITYTISSLSYNIRYAHYTNIYYIHYTIYTLNIDLLHLRVPVPSDGGAVRDLRRGVCAHHLLPAVQRGRCVIV